MNTVECEFKFGSEPARPICMPHRITTVYQQIVAHPFYQETDESFQFALAFAGRGYSWRTRANNKWARAIWRYMYENGPQPSNCEDWPEQCPSGGSQE